MEEPVEIFSSLGTYKFIKDYARYSLWESKYGYKECFDKGLDPDVVKKTEKLAKESRGRKSKYD